ncbi:hypothetical protein [Streptomyces griseomycini]|uniref:Uncharacterized protein n=1 Tax=Streptomyces griseomycini TaxID=66895 RepID=A0A7W7PWD1_9ACTN|nr:hypothetical protein [Streptomyces griseomycini]MBB4902567.1 hypothetical protein [Streptomyces griseomycini]GGR54209.1 hypothetical protein GCM10015536_69380 [Streptomyces griseomycini]
MSDENAFVIFTVIGVAHLAGAYLTWSRRSRWEADTQRWRGVMRWFSGQRQLNAELALGVLFLGLGLAIGLA